MIQHARWYLNMECLHYLVTDSILSFWLLLPHTLSYCESRYGAYVPAIQCSSHSIVHISITSIHASRGSPYCSFLDRKYTFLLGPAKMGGTGTQGDWLQLSYVSLNQLFFPVQNMVSDDWHMQCIGRTPFRLYTWVLYTPCWMLLPWPRYWNDSRLNMGHWRPCFYSSAVSNL